jgi:hypothetical protein
MTFGRLSGLLVSVSSLDAGRFRDLILGGEGSLVFGAFVVLVEEVGEAGAMYSVSESSESSPSICSF